MKNRFKTTLMASALLALGFVAAVPARAGIGSKKVTSYIEAARGVFGGDKTAAEAVSAAAKNKATAGEIAAAVAAAQVAKEDAGAEALAGIVNAAGDFASRAAATVSAVTGVDIASALSDPAVVDAAKDPDSVLSATDKADLKGLYDKVLAALKGAGYKMKEDGDKVEVDADAAAAASEGGKDGEGAEGAEGAGSGATAGAGDENLGDPVDQTIDNPHEYHATPTTISGLDPLVPAVVVPPVTSTPSKYSKPKHTKPSPTPHGQR